jgi:hypothetical protein
LRARWQLIPKWRRRRPWHFIVCVACLDGWEDRQPLALLEHYQAEDAKILSRGEALALLDALELLVREY